MVRWGQTSFSPDALKVAKAVFRPDLYDAALGAAADDAGTDLSGAVGAFAGPPFDADDIAGHLASFRIGRQTS
jgi:NitT/TauT family transport system ATP-binding protein